METPEDIWGNLEIPIDPLPDFDPAFQPLQYRVFQLFLFYLENFIMKMPINVQDLELQILKNKVQNQLRNLVFPLEEMALESITVNEMPYCVCNSFVQGISKLFKWKCFVVGGKYYATKNRSRNFSLNMLLKKKYYCNFPWNGFPPQNFKIYFTKLAQISLFKKGIYCLPPPRQKLFRDL